MGLELLRAFESRTCVQEAPGDPLIPVASSVIDAACELTSDIPSNQDSISKRLQERPASASLAGLLAQEKKADVGPGLRLDESWLISSDGTVTFPKRSLTNLAS